MARRQWKIHKLDDDGRANPTVAVPGFGQVPNPGVRPVKVSQGKSRNQSWATTSKGKSQAGGSSNGYSQGPDYSACNVDYGDSTIESWDCYEVEDPIVQSLPAHQGFTAAWVGKADGIRVLLTDDFESYSAEDPVSSTLNGGSGWEAAWTLTSKT